MLSSLNILSISQRGERYYVLRLFLSGNGRHRDLLKHTSRFIYAHFYSWLWLIAGIAPWYAGCPSLVRYVYI